MYPLCLDPCEVRGKAKLSSPALKQVEEGKKLTVITSEGAEGSPVRPPVSSPISKSPLKGERRHKTKCFTNSPITEIEMDCIYKAF